LNHGPGALLLVCFSDRLSAYLSFSSASKSKVSWDFSSASKSKVSWDFRHTPPRPVYFWAIVSLTFAHAGLNFNPISVSQGAEIIGMYHYTWLQSLFIFGASSYHRLDTTLVKVSREMNQNHTYTKQSTNTYIHICVSIYTHICRFCCKGWAHVIMEAENFP
jgi:hypothetical protein